ncbi:dTMP kinase [Nonomuraea solani]|nr:AAA family ATPase [Nonomuraea solani]
MAGKPGKLITVAGIDGAGKSTLAASLHSALKDSTEHTILVGKHTTEVPMSADLSQYVDDVNAVVYRRKPGVGAACGNHYWLFALAAWYTLQDQLIIKPALQAGVHVILDNAHHKILARYAVSPDVPTDLARQLFAHLTTPDLILFLHITADEALRRRNGDFSALEAGRTGSTGEAFISYQTHVTEELRRQATDATWASMDVTRKDADAVLTETLALLSECLDIRIP